MKQVKLILQSKGGVGKSLLLWFIAQAEKESKATFIDLDESTQTSIARLGSVVGETRVKHFKILNENKKLEREKILNLFEAISSTKTDKIYIDFGAPESEEFRKLLEFDIPPQMLANELHSMGIDVQIFVVVAGRDALQSCLNYYKAMADIVVDKIPIKLLMNEGTFGGVEAIKAGHDFFQSQGIDYLPFGGLGESESGRDVIELITEKKYPETLNLAGRITYRKAFEQVQEILAS